MNKVMFSTYGLSHGGAERVLSILASELADRNYQVFLVLDKKYENEYEISTKVRKIYLDSDREDKKNGVIFTLKKIIKFRRIVNEIKPDILISFLSIIPSYLASVFTKTKFVTTMRNDPNAYVKLKFIRDYCIKKSDMLIIQNEEQSDYFKNMNKDKIKILYNPVDDSFFKVHYEFSNKIEKLYTVGRLVYQKNQKMLIDTVVRLHREFPSISLDIFGEGPLKDELLERVKIHKADEYIKLRGISQNLTEELNEYDMFILSSRYEGMPNTLIEAMACGIPCVSTDCRTGPKSLIKNNENGYLVKNENEEDMYQILRHCILNPGKFEAKLKKSKKFIRDNCKKKIIVDKFIKILNETMGEEIIDEKNNDE